MISPHELRALSITFRHDENMQPFERHWKTCTGLIVKMDNVEYKKADGYVAWNLGAADLSLFADDLNARYLAADRAAPSEGKGQKFESTYYKVPMPGGIYERCK